MKFKRTNHLSRKIHFFPTARPKEMEINDLLFLTLVSSQLLILSLSFRLLFLVLVVAVDVVGVVVAAVVIVLRRGSRG